jgi:glycosyltransferase involved in cell wall biosynthesis
MPDLYRAADVFVLCSLKEMLGTVLLEASATAVPCLVHQHPSMRWVIGAGGIVLDMSAKGALAAAMQQLLRDGDQRRELGAKARQQCLSTFGRDRIVGEYLDYYGYVFRHDRPGTQARDAGKHARRAKCSRQQPAVLATDVEST